jgi:hypothetical protein
MSLTHAGSPDVFSIARELKSLEGNEAAQRSVIYNLSTNRKFTKEILESFARDASSEDIRILGKCAFEAQDEDLYSRLVLESDYFAPIDADSEDEKVWRGFKEKVEESSPRLLMASLRVFKVDEFEYLWKDDLLFLVSQVQFDSLNLTGLGSITRIVWNQSAEKNRALNIRHLLLTIWQSCLDLKLKPHLKPGNWKEVDHKRISLYREVLDRAVDHRRKQFELWDEKTVRNLIIASIRAKGQNVEVIIRFCKDFRVSNSEQEELLKTRVEPNMSPAEVAPELEAFDELKDQEWAINLLTKFEQSWTDEEIKGFALSVAIRSQHLRTICSAAMRFNEELYVRLTAQDIAPIEVDNQSEEAWKSFMERILNSKSSAILLASLRFFRADEPFEKLWKDHLQFLMDRAEVASTNVRGLGSITRIIWNQSTDNDRAENVYNLLLRIWKGCMDDVESKETTAADRERVGKFHNALVASGEAASIFSSWDQVAVRNLISESVLGRETKGAVTRRFCKELGIEAKELTSLLAESQIS